MSFRLQRLDRVAVSFFGEGASNAGTFQEGLNLAAVQDAPVIFVCENNLCATSTHITLTTRIANIAEREAAYSMPGVVVDGMDVEAVYAAARTAVARARAGKARSSRPKPIAIAVTGTAIPAVTGGRTSTPHGRRRIQSTG
jgi:acetoin:2,6-dichlorophenolindophenol oxidoreductase subunit alpha